MSARHTHTCPECYAHAPCDDARCDCLPGVALDDGTPRGGFCVCDACAMPTRHTWQRVLAGLTEGSEER